VVEGGLWSAFAFHPAFVEPGEPSAPPVTIGVVDEAPDARRLEVVEGGLWSAFAFHPAFVEPGEPPAPPVTIGVADEAPDASRAEVVEGGLWSAFAFHPASVDYVRPVTPPEHAGLVDEVPSDAIRAAVTDEIVRALAVPAPAVDRGVPPQPAASPEDDLRALIESLRVAEDGPAPSEPQERDFPVEINLTDALVIPAPAEPPAAVITPVGETPVTITPAIAATAGPATLGASLTSVAIDVAAAPSVQVRRAAAPVPPAHEASKTDEPAPAPQSEAPASATPRAGGGRRRRSRGRGKKEEVPYSPEPDLEATLPVYAPWLAGDPLPPGASEANSTPRSVVPAPGSAQAQATQEAPADAPAPPEAPAPIRLAPPPEPPAPVRVIRGAEPATSAGMAQPPKPTTPIRLAPSLAEPPRPSARTSHTTLPVGSAPIATDLAPAKKTEVPESEYRDVSPVVAHAAWAAEVAASGGSWRRVMLALVAMVLLAGVAFAAYWYVRPSAEGSLVVQSSVEGIDVLVDGRSRGMTPLKVQLSAGRHVIEMHGFGVIKTLPVEIAAGVQTTQNVKWPAGGQGGRLKVTSTPPGARVRVDGEMRGVTPVEIEAVPVGAHTIVLASDSGVVKKAVKVVEGETAEVDAAIFSGWLTVIAPFRVSMFEDGALLGTSEDGNKVLLSCGTHTLEIVNKGLNVKEVRTVEITPGGTTNLSIVAPRSSIDVEAPDGTEVWVDDVMKGHAPLGPIDVPVGTHDVLLRNAQLSRKIAIAVVAGTPTKVSPFTPR
jgi:hypothetical protein